MNIKVFIFSVLALFLLFYQQALSLEFMIRGSVDETFDDNINASRNNPESDWITNLIIGLGARSDLRDFDLDVFGNIYQQYYINNKENNGIYEDCSIGLSKNFADTVIIRLNDIFIHYPQPRDFGVLLSRSETDESGYISNDFSTGFSVNVTRKFAFNINYRNSILKNDTNTFEDSVYHEAEGSFNYSFNSANTIRTGYSYGIMKYDSGNGSKNNSGFVEYEKLFTRQLYSIIRGGYDYIIVDSTEYTITSKSYMGSASLIDDIDDNNHLNFTLMKERTMSDVVEDIFDYWNLSLTLQRGISDRTSIDLSLFYGEGNYLENNSKNRLGGASVSLGFALTEFVNMEAGYIYTWSYLESSVDDGYSFNRNQLSAGISGEY